MLCKVADFGLSRVLETADSSRGEYQTTVSEKLDQHIYENHG